MMMMTMLTMAITVTESRDSNVKKTMMVMMTLTYLQLRHFGGAALQLHCILTPPCHHHRDHNIVFSTAGALVVVN